MFKEKSCPMFNFVLAAFLMGIFVISSSYAEDNENIFTLEEISVTAEKREASLQKTALSITAVAGENIRELGLVSVDDILKNVPNVIVQGASRGFVIAIRGVGSDLPTGIGESSVSTNFDGVYNFMAEAGLLGYYDLSRVEVLRGPQGTLYGRNATAGVVNVISKNPSDDFGGYGTFEVGTNSLLRTEGAVNVPINDETAARMSFVTINRDGYLSNGKNDAVGSGARMKVRHSPSDNTEIILSSEFTKIGGKGIGQVSLSDFLAGNEYNDPSAEYQSQDAKSYKLSATIEFAAGPGVVTFIPAYQHAEGVLWGDWWQGMEQSLNPRDGEQISAELRFASKADANIQWVTGLYYYDLNNEIVGSENPNGKTDMTTSYAAFGQVTVPVTDSLRTIVGTRVGYDEKSFIRETPEPPTMEDEWNSFDWKLGLEADLSEDVLAYLTLASGHRPGGFNSNPGKSEVFDPEEIVSAELGIKSRFMSDRLQVNANAFYYDFRDFQVSDFYLPESGGGAEMFIWNCGDVLNYGVEFETEMLLTYSTIGNFDVTYLSSEYQDSFLLHEGSVAVDMKGETLPHAPELTIQAGLEHTFFLGNIGTLIPSIDVRWIDDQWVAPFPGEQQLQEAYTIYDVALRYVSQDNSWSINAYVKNAGDEAIKIAFFDPDIKVGNPRQAGVVFNAKF